ncbi:nucleosidase [Cloacibacterium sp.]|jgi:adenosylhomocysteine nucleosidase|uniref:5'-methylthioadenosine/S-adenosylhomocysteine nucleosidase family protein n=1 Tax=Cloacibacterium sp. TaxID=1913682 RepID=UPI0035B44F3C
MENIKINNKIYQNPLFVFALEKEAGTAFSGENVTFVGVGKINATYNLLKAILKHNPDIIINLGTAGSTKFNKGEVVCCTEFIQRDMDVMALGFQKFETPFSTDAVILEYGIELEGLPKGICGSGDQFEMEHKNPEYNIIEMEAFALAKVSKEENIPFLSLKFISDGADGGAAEDWVEQVKYAASAFKKILFDK